MRWLGRGFRFQVALVHADTVILRVFDTAGLPATQPVSEFLDQGHYQVNFKDITLATGLYFLQCKASDTTWVKKFILMMADK